MPRPPTLPAGAWWHDITVPPRPSLMHDQHVDVCVIGLGASGLAAVRAARALGARVLGVDAGRIAGAAAGRNGGLLLAGMAEFHHDLAAITGAAPAAALYQHTLRALVDLRREHPEETWWPGSLRLADSDAEQQDLAAQHARMQADGLDVSWYEGAQGCGLLFPHDGACHPVRRALAMAARAEADGAQLAEYSPVAHVEPGGARLANGVHVTAPIILVCTDGAIARLWPTVSTRVRSVRLQMCATAPAHDVQIPRPAYVRYGFDYWQQLADGRVLIGGGRDHFVDESFTSDDTPSDGVQEWLTSRLRETIGTQAPITHRWAATVTYTDPPLPIAEQLAEGVWGAGGYSGTGNVVGTLCGAGIARRALGAADAFLDTLDAARRAATTLATLLLAVVLGLAMSGRETFAQGGAAPPVRSTPTPPAQAPGPMPQAPSPMVETTRAHERLEARELPGAVRSVSGPSGREVSVYITPAVRDTYDLVVHFHGAAWLPHQAVHAQGAPLVSAVVNLGGGSGVYTRGLGEHGALDSLLARVQRTVLDLTSPSRPGAPVRRRLVLTAFSAGYGAVRTLLQDSLLASRVHAVLLLDGLHASYLPEGRPLAEGGVLEPAHLAPFVAYASRAMRGDTRFVITHSMIFPGTYASTTEVTDGLLDALGLRRTAILAWGPRGMQQLSRVQEGSFEVLGFAGNSAPDHVDHLHALPELLGRVLGGGPQP